MKQNKTQWEKVEGSGGLKPTFVTVLLFLNQNVAFKVSENSIGIFWGARGHEMMDTVETNAIKRHAKL